MKRQAPYRYPAQRALRVLEVLARRPASINELARLLRMDRATAKRIVDGLAEVGYLEAVTHDKRNRYRVAAAARELGTRLQVAPRYPPDPPSAIRGLPDRDPDETQWRAWIADLERRSSGSR